MPKKPKLSLLEAFQILNLDPGNLDIPYMPMAKNKSMYAPYDRGNSVYRDRSYNRGGYPTRKPDSTYTEEFKELTDLNNLQRNESRMPEYDGIPKKEKNRAKLSEALLPFIGSILPF